MNVRCHGNQGNHFFAKFGQNSRMNLLNLVPFQAKISSIINRNIKTVLFLKSFNVLPIQI